MKKNEKVLAIMLGCTTFAMALTGCGGKATSTTETRTTSTTATTTETWTTAGSPYETESACEAPASSS